MQQPQSLWWYYTLQGLLIAGLGAAYEMLVLSDYGNRGEDHGRSFMFWTGKALQEASFKKGITKTSTILRRCRNLICQASMLIVLVLDPIASYLLSEASVKCGIDEEDT